MPRYRVSFSRDWALGRWGYLDRFFHDLGGREASSAGLESAWIVEYRGDARSLGRELAVALRVQQDDVTRFGPIFNIEELSDERRPPRTDDARGPQPGPASGPSTRQQPAPAPAEEPPAAPGGPSWVADAVVEDVSVTAEPAAQVRGKAQAESEKTAASPAAKDAPDGSIRAEKRPAAPEAKEGARAKVGAAKPAADAATQPSPPIAPPQQRSDELFRIRKQSRPRARRRAEAIASASRSKPRSTRQRAEAIAGASRRKPSGARPSSE